MLFTSGKSVTRTMLPKRVGKESFLGKKGLESKPNEFNMIGANVKGCLIVFPPLKMHSFGAYLPSFVLDLFWFRWSGHTANVHCLGPRKPLGEATFGTNFREVIAEPNKEETWCFIYQNVPNYMPYISLSQCAS